jgi:hypothetical protein
MGSLQVESPNVVCVLIFTYRGVFIGVQRGVTDLVKSVTLQVVVGRSSNMAGWTCGSASTDLAFPFSCRHVCIKPRAKPTQNLAGRPGDLAGRLPPGPTGQWPLHTASSCQVHPRVTLILVEFQISL